VATYFDYPCPDCRTTNNLHETDCRFAGTSWARIEKAYVDIVAVLSADPRPEAALRDAVDGDWGALHAAALSLLRDEYRVYEVGSDGDDGDAAANRVRAADGDLALTSPEQRREHLSQPDRDPLRTIYRQGSVPGCHDNAVFAMIAYYEMVGFSWRETKENVVEWLRESGTWARGGFEEASPEALVDSKRHVYEEGYGWKEKATAAKRVIDRRT
jgi:hypothetical protein